MNRIRQLRARRPQTDSAAAAVPITVIGAITTATARLATTATTLNVPEMAATSGAVTSCAATATLTASANGLGQPRATSRRDHPGAITTSAAVADTDKAKPTSTASSGAAIISAMTAADSTGIACLRRCVTTASSVMAAITAARNTLADGCTTMTNATNAAPANTTAVRGPTNTAVSSTAPQTIVTFAPDTAVRCVSPDARNSAVVSADSAEVSPRTRAGSIAAWSAGKASRAAVANALRTRCPARWIGAASPSVGSPVADSTATVRSRRVGLEIRALNAAGWPAVELGESGHRRENRPPGRTFRRRRRLAEIPETSTFRRRASAASRLA